MKKHQKNFLAAYGNSETVNGLFQGADDKLLRSIAKNPITSPKHLDELSENEDEIVLGNLVHNPSVQSHHLDRILKNEDS